MKNIIPFIFIPLSIAILFFYVRPEYATISDLIAKKSDYVNALAKTKDLATLRNDLLSKYNNLPESDKSKLQNMIPSKFDSVKLVSDINAVAVRHGMVLRAVKIQNDKATDSSQPRSDIIGGTSPVMPYKTENVSFTVSGQYKSFLAFLRDIESSEELLDVRKLNINTAKSVTGGSVFDFSVTLETYFIN